ncbi:MAG TPA: YdeI/OmpD-associated family protein [Candidatus Dormibacteraeota bacterium]|nr:YdeI/OmpD-associated family protein [Candidatus Dormibacteraeota bacterium]
MDSDDVHFFVSPEEFREWLEQHHDSRRQLWVGFHKTRSGYPSITWPEAVDEALCFGWIDGIRKSIDDADYTIRFTPRRPGSTWSSVNVKRVQELIEEGRMRSAGLAAFQARKPAKTGVYSYETQPATLTEDEEKLFRANDVAWRFFESEPPSYRRVCIWWVVSPKQEATRKKRLAVLIEDSENHLKSATYKRASGGAYADKSGRAPR